MKLLQLLDGINYKVVKGNLDKEMSQPATENQKKTFMEICKTKGVDYNDILKQVGVNGKMTKGQYGQALNILKGIE